VTRSGNRAGRNAARGGWLAVILGALFLVGGCNRQEIPEGRAAEGTTPEVATTAAFVQSWTSRLLDGVARPVLVFDQNLGGAEPKVSPAQATLLRSTRLLVSTGGEVDAFVRAARIRQAGEAAPQAAPYDETIARTWVWLDPARAAEGVRVLSEELQKVYPREAGRIADNETALVERHERLDARLSALAAPLRGRRVFLADAQLQPLADWLGLEVVEYLSHRQGMAPTGAEGETFRAALRREAAPVLVAGEQIPRDQFEKSEEDATVIVVVVDPVLVGYVGPQQYEQAMERNVLVLLAALGADAGGS
jgi:ABC-type Zn uptake system ZnuABC Zn-binding protein ZnuA